MLYTKNSIISSKLQRITPFILFISLFFCTIFGFCAQNYLDDSDNQAKVYCNRGWGLLKEGNLDAAVYNYMKAIELDSYCVQAYNDLGIIFEVKADLGQAKEMYQKAIEIAPAYLKSYSNLALLYEKQGDYAHALILWQKRLDLSDPEDPYTEIVRKRIEAISRIYPEGAYKIIAPDEGSSKKIVTPKEESLEPAEKSLTLKKESEQLQGKLTSLQNDKADLERGKNSLLQEVASLREAKSEIEIKLAKVGDLNKQLENKTQELYLKQQEVDQVKKDLQNLNNTIERITGERLSLKKENEELKGKVALVEDTLKNVNAQLKTKENELNLEAQKRSETKQGLRSLNNVNKRIAGERLALKGENEVLQQRVALFENSLKNVNTQLQAKAHDFSDKIKEAEQMKGAIQELNNKLESATQESYALKRESEQLQGKLTSQQQEFYLKQQEVDQAKKDLQNLNNTIERITGERLSLKKENEELKGKIASYTDSSNENERLRRENSDLTAELSNLQNFNSQLEIKAKELYIKAKNTEEIQKNFNNLNNIVEKINKERFALKKDNEELRQVAIILENTLRGDKAILYRELGTAYTKAKIFNLAIEAYLKSLSFNPRDAEVHYNLGILYKHYLDNTKKATYHLKKYLEFNSKAPNKKEVEYLIGMLGEKKF